jgi:hypothetical protein
LRLANGHSALYPRDVPERRMPIGLPDELHFVGKMEKRKNLAEGRRLMNRITLLFLMVTFTLFLMTGC